MEQLTEIQEEAIKMWHEMGDTTPANNILNFAYEAFIKPMGIKADAYVYDALKATEDDSIVPTLPSIRFDSALIDEQWEQYERVKPLKEFADLIEPVFNELGEIIDIVYKHELTADENTPQLEDFLNNRIEDLFELNQSVLAAAKLFVDGALELMIRPEPQSQDLAKAFVENRRRYPEIVFALFTQQEESTSKE